MSEPFIGEIKLVGFNFAPRGWAFCNGQILSIAQNTALFALLGTTYGGNGQTTFALPNLQGRVPMHFGNGAGLSPRALGETGGAENVTLLTTQMPSHTHPMTSIIKANNGAATDSIPTGNFLAADNQYAGTANTTMNSGSVENTMGVAGGNQPHSNMQPYQVVNYIIALQGIFPSRN